MLTTHRLLGPDNTLNLIRVDEPGQVAVGHGGLRQPVTPLLLGLCLHSAKDAVQLVKG